MSFKVVLIKELQEIEPVPAEWEDNGVLYWPNDEKIRKLLQSNKNSCPDKETWKTYHCLVKANNILIYGDASNEAQWFINNTTEDESNVANAKKRVKKNPGRRLQKNKKPKKKQKKYNFENLLPPLPPQIQDSSHHVLIDPNAVAQLSLQNSQPQEVAALVSLIRSQSQLSDTNSQFQQSLPVTTTCTTTSGQLNQLLKSSQATSHDVQQLVPSNRGERIEIVSSQLLNTSVQPQQFTIQQSSTTNKQFQQLIPLNSALLSHEFLQNINKFVVTNSDESQKGVVQTDIDHSQPQNNQHQIDLDKENKSPNDENLPMVEDYFREYYICFSCF